MKRLRRSVDSSTGAGSFSVFMRIWSRLKFCSGAAPSANSSSVMPKDQMSALQSYLRRAGHTSICCTSWSPP